MLFGSVSRRTKKALKEEDGRKEEKKTVRETHTKKNRKKEWERRQVDMRNSDKEDIDALS